MLAVIPSILTDEKGILDVINPANQNELKRFFVGPNGCKVSGVAFASDFQNFLVNIQHPCNWSSNTDAPMITEAGVTVRSRACTVAIRSIDGGSLGV